MGGYKEAAKVRFSFLLLFCFYGVCVCVCVCGGGGGGGAPLKCGSTNMGYLSATLLFGRIIEVPSTGRTTSYRE